MPVIQWQTPQYDGHDVIEMATVAPRENHPDEMIGRFPEHVLMLLRENWAPGEASWGMVWLVHDVENNRWGQRLLATGPSPDNGDSERKLIRQCKEEITGRVSG